MAEEAKERALPGREFGDVLTSIAEFQARHGMEHADLLLFMSLVDLLAVLNLLHRRWASAVPATMPAGAMDLVSQVLKMLPGRGSELANLLGKDAGNLASLASAIAGMLRPPAGQHGAGGEKVEKAEKKEPPSRDVVRWDFGKR
ncbi:MAG: hypothetical protein ACUVRO_10470 [Armatimonadota bacterium]